MADDVVSVLTYKSAKTILDTGGTQSWVLDPSRVKKCKYAVICRNGRTFEAEGSEPHGSVFMVGKVRDVVPSTDKDGRWLVRFSEYALCDWPNEWKGRNPVAYWKTSDYAVGHQGFEELDFQPMPDGSYDREVAEGLTIPAAKLALAKTLGIGVENIEITIRV